MGAPLRRQGAIASVDPSAEGEIKERIAVKGKITFPEFMELALYHPRGGYYSRHRSRAAHGDYYTSPQAHPAFGALIAVQLCRMWELLGEPSPFHAVEVGAGTGLLARDVLRYASDLPRAFSKSLRYTTIDRFPEPPSERDGPCAFRRLDSAMSPPRGVQGCVLSNELVDSFPVHRFQIEGSSVKEVFVTLESGRFEEVLDEPSTPLIERRLLSLDSTLPDGYRGEVNLQTDRWMAQTAEVLREGFALTIDYGYEATDLYSPERAGGTVQSHYRHGTGASLYQRIGMQDITAHVDFTSLVREGMAVGLRPIGLYNQARFLRDLGLERWLHALRTEDLAQKEREANLMAMRDLVRPDGLGRFKVLVQEKGTGVQDLEELLPVIASAEEDETWASRVRPPLLRAEHAQLMEERYPHLGWTGEGLWPPGKSR